MAEPASPRPWASVIIPVWNGRSYLPACLDALLAQAPAGYEVIAVDNASTDGSGDLIAAAYSGVRLIRNSENLGFAGACNAGLRAARGGVLVLLNQDTRVCDGWLEALARACREPGVGVAGSKALYPDGKTIQHAGGRVEWPRAMTAHDGRGEADRGQWDVARAVDFVSGTAIAFRRDVLEQVGALDEGFWPGYYEDADFCFRVRDAGYEVRYTPDARLIHDESTALGGTSALAPAFQRGRLRFVLKHLSPERYLSEFVPAERAFLLPYAGQEIAYALRGLYVEMMPEAALILTHRWKSDTALVTQVLAALLRLYQDATPGPVQVGPVLGELEFVSPVPLLGPMIARLRSLWYSVAARWAVRHLAGQQAAINAVYQRRIEEQEAMNGYAVRALMSVSRELAHLVGQRESGQDDHG